MIIKRRSSILKFSRNFLIGFILLLCVSLYGIINLTGWGAIAAIVSAVFGSQGGFVFVPFLSEDKISAHQSVTSTGMVVLYSNNPPSGYHAAEGATVTIGGVKGTTDGQGYFNLSGLPVGLNTLTVEYGSFVSIEQPVVVADPNGSSVSFSGFKVIPERLLCPVGIGGTYQFSVYAADSNGNPVIPSATWSVEGDIGTVSSTGIFTATKSGIGKVVALNGSNRSDVSITVTDGSGTVKGAVTYNGNGLSGVKVKAENFTNYAVTDGSGHYILPGIPSNPVTVIVTATDGKTGTGYGSVPAGGEVEVNIVLTGAVATATVIPTAVTNATSVAEPPMVSIPGGTFEMGSNVSADEQPVHSVTVSSFNMFKYEVRNSDYVLFLNSEGNQTEGGVKWIKLTADEFQGITGGPGAGTFSVVPGYESRPVVLVSWYGAVAYCNWLSSQHGLTPCYGSKNNRGYDPSVWRTLNGYRLPTEAEWEYACRGGSTAEYYWGDPYPPDPPNIGNYAWYYSNSGGNHHDVGQLLPNSFGLYDMSGNVFEWCSDWDDFYYYGISPGTNPTGPATGSFRAIRGGCWEVDPDNCRSAYRSGCALGGRLLFLGFRPVRN